MIYPVPGVRLGTAAAHIKRADRQDILVIEAAPGSNVAAVFTQNAFCAAPVQVAKSHLPHAPRWLLINSGNANAGTGPRGLDDALSTCRALALKVDAKPEAVLPFSTGVIGEFLPVEKIEKALPQALENLTEQGWDEASRAIMTTDTRPKRASRQIVLEGGKVTVTGIAKGAGMIHPNMATMLAFVATDAVVDRAWLQPLLERVADRTFNCVTVDGDTSTNDACVLVASGRSAAIVPESEDAERFEQAVFEVCQDLAEMIVRDGEGATKFMRIQVKAAADREEARRVAQTVALSPLVKTAFFASDPNWGRILAAVGRAGCKDLEIDRVSIWLGDVAIVEKGGRAPGYTEAQGARVMAEADIDVCIDLGRGQAEETVMTCDFSYDYVRINAEYRT